MPRRTRRETYQADAVSDAEENEAEHNPSQVANVNNGGESSQSQASSGKRTPKKGKRKVDSCPNKKRKVEDKSKNRRVLMNNDQDQPNQNNARAVVQEDNQTIVMTVENVNFSDVNSGQSRNRGHVDQDYVDLNAEDSEDGEIHFRDEDLESAQMTQQDDEAETVVEPIDLGAPNDLDTEARDPTTDRAEQVRRIDREMLSRIEELHNIMLQGGLEASADMLDRCASMVKPKRRPTAQDDNTQGMNVNRNAISVGKQPSVPYAKSLDTIYESAVPRKDRNSSSSEEEIINTSDEIDLAPLNGVLSDVNNHQHNFPLQDVRRREDQQAPRGQQRNDRYHYTRPIEEQPQPGTSDGRRGFGTLPYQMTPEEKAQKMIREAEAAKARIFAAPGIENFASHWEGLTPTAVCDEGYIVVSGHLDESTVVRISKGEYVDFSKLLPRDRVCVEDDGRMEMCVKNGKTFWVPVSHSVNITNFNKWEQAFRVYSNIYTKANPARAAELIEYNHVIHNISMSYIWDNVYSYDKEFRLHMGRNPNRSWAMILQQAWSLRLRDRLSAQQYNTHNTYPSSNNRAKVPEPCRRFNRGRCNFGSNCRYEHRCGYCFKFGHAVLTCRKAASDKVDKGSSPGNSHNGNGNQGGQHQGASHQNHQSHQSNKSGGPSGFQPTDASKSK